MREVRRLLGAVAVAVLLTTVGACGSSTTTNDVQITQLANAKSGDLSLTSGWVLEPEGGSMADMPGMSAGETMVAAYGIFQNAGVKADALTSVVAPDGATAQLHVTKDDATSGTMSRVASLSVPAGGQLTLKPGGTHVMLTGLKPLPKAGDHVTLTFVFRSGARITVPLPVIPPSERPSS